jgi:transposase
MPETNPAEVIIGVDTHKHVHVAVALTTLGARLGTITIPANRQGYQELEAWAQSFGPVRAYGVEGSGSYGAGLSRFLQASGNTVIEVNRPNRQLRYQHGKSDPLDAEGAARVVLSGQADALAKPGTRSVEMIRHLKVARDTAVKSRTQAMVTLKALIVSAPAALREQLEGISGKMALIRHLAALRPGALTSTTASAKAALRALARRWLALDAEIKAHDAHLDALTAVCTPTLMEVHGISTGTAAEMLVLPRCWSLLVIILIGSAPKRPLPSCAGPVRSRPQAARQSGIG